MLCNMVQRDASVRRPRAVIAAAVIVIAAAATAIAAPLTRAQPNLVSFDCGGYVKKPPSGSFQWQLLDAEQRWCATEGTRDSLTNLALLASEADVSPGYLGDPLRDPARWAGRDKRGSYATASFVDRYGTRRDVLLFGPLRAGRRPRPGVLIPCYNAWAGVKTCPWFWTAEMLAEAGYVVMMADTSFRLGEPTNVDAVMGFMPTADALDFLVSTPSHRARGSVNPWWHRLDRSRIGCVGHSGNGAACFALGRDHRIKAIVGYDPAGGDGGNAIGATGPSDIAAPRMTTVPDVPTMTQRADYWLTDPLTPKPEQPKPYYQESDFSKIRATGADEMHVVLRSATHLDWARTFVESALPYSRYGEQVAAYYTLAWLDRYVKGLTDRRVAVNALKRLLAKRFDDSTDRYSIGIGTFDPAKAAAAHNLVAGNVPITIAGTPVRNLISFWFNSGYWLEHGRLRSDDVRDR